MGILLVNMGWYIEGPMSRLDLWVARAVDLWFSGKFYPLFAMLLGVGVHLQSRRFGSDFVCTFSRRLIILALIGLSFCLLIEDRSGLLSYALLGMFLVPLRNIRFGHLVALVVSLVSMPACACLLAVLAIRFRSRRLLPSIPDLTL